MRSRRWSKHSLQEKTALAGERDVALAQRDATLQENEKLLLLLSQFKRMLFGRRSEKVDPDQLHLLPSEAESGVAAANENDPRLDKAGRR